MNKGVMGDGKKRCVAVINSGEFFGEIGCLVPEPMNVRGNTVKAAEQSVLYKLDRLDLLWAKTQAGFAVWESPALLEIALTRLGSIKTHQVAPLPWGSTKVLGQY